MTGRRLGRGELRAGSRAEKMLRAVGGQREGERGDMRRGRGTRRTELTVTEGRAGRGGWGPGLGDLGGPLGGTWHCCVQGAAGACFAMLLRPGCRACFPGGPGPQLSAE